jgi:hypothetical protein
MAQNLWIFRLFRMCRWMRVVSMTVALGLALAAQGQAAANVIDDMATPQDIETALHQMADRAGVIFVGRVVRVQRRDGGGVSSGFVEVTFEVDQAVRGCSSGNYVLREWAGLWEGDAERYRVGQRLLMLLHAPGASGMSSPVDGMDGAIPIVRGGAATLAANSSARRSPPAVDLRWVGTKLLHSVFYGSGVAEPVNSSSSRPTRGVVQARGLAGGSVIEAAPVTVSSESEGPGSASVPAQEAAVDTVVAMLTLWQKAQYAVR